MISNIMRKEFPFFVPIRYVYDFILPKKKKKKTVNIYSLFCKYRKAVCNNPNCTPLLLPYFNFFV